MAASRVLLEEDEKVVGPFTFTSASHAEVTTYSELFGAPVYGSAYEPNSFTAGATLMSLVEPSTATPPEDETTGAYMASGASLPPLFSPAATTAPSVGESLSQQSQHQVPRISPQAFPSSPVPPHSSMDEAIRAFADQVPTYRAVPSEVLDAAPKINRGFSVDSKATQIFMGQLPATITAERLATAIDVMLEWTDVPLVVHLRPAQGANQASHAIVTVESKDAKAVLSLNRRAYFTGKALYYAAAISDTPTFQRIISKSINSVSGTPDALSGLARACVVVEGANRPKPSNAAAPPRSSPHSAARTPQSTTSPATVQASRGQRQQHHHQPQQPQYVARGRNVGPAPPPYVPAAPPTNCVIATTSPHGFTTVTFASPMPWAAVPYAPQIIFAPRAGVY